MYSCILLSGSNALVSNLHKWHGHTCIRGRRGMCAVGLERASVLAATQHTCSKTQLQQGPAPPQEPHGARTRLRLASSSGCHFRTEHPGGGGTKHGNTRGVVPCRHESKQCPVSDSRRAAPPAGPARAAATQRKKANCVPVLGQRKLAIALRFPSYLALARCLC